jgi:ankyrin repeat protein
LLDCGAHINGVGGSYGTAPVTASSNGKEENVQILLDRGADIDMAADAFHGAAHHGVAAKGHRKIVGTLIDSGNDINANSGDYGAALIIAFVEGNVEIVQHLIGGEADGYIRTGRRVETVLYAAA